jgi:hypothetical protein
MSSKKTSFVDLGREYRALIVTVDGRTSVTVGRAGQDTPLADPFLHVYDLHPESTELADAIKRYEAKGEPGREKMRTLARNRINEDDNIKRRSP